MKVSTTGPDGVVAALDVVLQRFRSWTDSEETETVEVEVELGIDTVPSERGAIGHVLNGTETITLKRNGGALDK